MSTIAVLILGAIAGAVAYVIYWLNERRAQ
jgi:hypothetical protein